MYERTWSHRILSSSEDKEMMDDYFNRNIIHYKFIFDDHITSKHLHSDTLQCLQHADRNILNYGISHPIALVCTLFWNESYPRGTMVQFSEMFINIKRALDKDIQYQTVICQMEELCGSRRAVIHMRHGVK
jgi:hypothetical protein